LNFKAREKSWHATVAHFPTLQFFNQILRSALHDGPRLIQGFDNEIAAMNHRIEANKPVVLYM
jgi:hypothetical protein